MKRTVLCMFVLSMVSLSFAAGEITFNFDGADAVGWNNGWGSSSISDLYATTGTNSLKVSNGWGPGFNFDGSDAIKNALGTVGKIKLDLTTVAADFPIQSWGGSYGDVGVFIQGPGFWVVGNWAGTVVLGTTQTITLQLSAADMASVAGDTSWFQAGIATNMPNAVAAVYAPIVTDPITGEYISGGELVSPAITPAMYFDNVQIVPEPATLVLLGLGTLASLKRRKA